LNWIGIELCDPPKCDGFNDTHLFVKEFEFQVPEQQRMLALDVFIKVTLTRWWDAHKEGMEDWSECKRLMQVRFGTEGENIAKKYT
jgi:hypothetical protein